MKLKTIVAAISFLAAQAIPNIAWAQAQPPAPLSGVLQADGTELAKQVIIFPKELRGAAEGSVLTDAPGATSHSRMTNGSVSKPAVSHSRMTNGSVEKGGGSTLVVRYQDGSQTISIPAGVPVTLVAKEL